MLRYHNPITTKTGLILSIDNVVLDLYISNRTARDGLMALMDNLPIKYSVTVTHWDSFKMGSFREQFSIAMNDGTSYWLGATLNANKPQWGRVRLDFNPNKVSQHAAFQAVLQYLIAHTRPMHRIIKRFDLAIDIPVPRDSVFLVKDNRAYIERRHGQEWTQYLGAKSSTVGRVKLYNKQTEARLNYPLTRLELTLDPAVPYEKVNFPAVYYTDTMQLQIDELKATDTERFILSALLQGFGSVNSLGRRTREKINKLLEYYVKYVEISAAEYGAILHQLNGYATGQSKADVKETDQPPPPPQQVPDWVHEAEQAEQDDRFSA